MKGNGVRVVIMKRAAIGWLIATLFATGAAHASGEAARTVEPARRSYGELPLSFIPNVGQTNAAVRFVAQGGGFSFFFLPSRAVLSFSKGERQLALALEMM